MKRQKIKPASGASVLNPQTGEPLKEKGARVIWGSYWDRRLADGSIVLVSGTLKDAIDKQNKAKKIAEKADAAQKKGSAAAEPVEG